MTASGERGRHSRKISRMLIHGGEDVDVCELKVRPADDISESDGLCRCRRVCLEAEKERDVNTKENQLSAVIKKGEEKWEK